MFVEFSRPALLYLLLLLPVFLVIFARKYAVTAVVVRTLVLALIVLALAGPQLTQLRDQQTVLFMVDGSWSVPEEELEWTERFISEALRHRQSEDGYGVTVFGQDVLLQRAPGPVGEDAAQSRSVRLLQRPDGRYTNIEEALRQGLALFPTGEGRIVLFSDGWETQGQARSVLEQYGRAGLAIDVVPLEPLRPEPEVTLVSLQVPAGIAAGEAFTGRAVLHSTGPTEAEVQWFLEDQLVQVSTVDLDAGYNHVPFSHTMAAQGTYELRAEVFSPDDTMVDNNHLAEALEVAGERAVLLVSESGTTQQRLVEQLAAQGIPIVQRPLDQFPASLSELQNYEVVIFNDVPARALSDRQYYLLQDYVSDLGGGLIISGGYRSFAMSDYQNSPLEVMLPVHSQRPEELAFPTLSLIIILDKSGSMRAVQPGLGGLTSMDVAKQAAYGVIELLLSEERLGIVAFDVDTEWVVPLQEVGDKRAFYEALQPFDAGTGGTNIYPSLVEAYEALKDEETAVQHVILLSDGVSQPGDYEGIMAKYQEAEITLSTVSIGSATDLELMAYLAAMGSGKHYYAEHVRSVPQIMATEAERILGAPIVEDEIGVWSTANTIFGQVTQWETAPPIQGFNVTTPKDLADVYLAAEDNSPILASWRFGLGRVMAFMSDTGQQWTDAWWDEGFFGPLWAAMIRWSVTDMGSQGLQSRFVYQDGQGELLVDAIDEQGRYVNHLQLEAQVYRGQQGIVRVELEQVGPGFYRAVVPLEEEGVYLATITGEVDGVPVQQRAAVAVPYSPEFGLPPTTDLLQDLAAETGGRVLAEPEEVFAARAAVADTPQELWHWTLGLALLLWLVDVGLRQLRGMR